MPPSDRIGEQAASRVALRWCWVRLDGPGHDAARLVERADGWTLAGAAALALDGRPGVFAYEVVLDREWRTRAARVEGWLGEREVRLALAADGRGTWTRDGRAAAELAGALDVDLGFTPATNLIPIRRLAPAAGVEVAVRAAWLEFPALALKPLEQTYRRLDESRCAYAAPALGFETTLEVDRDGAVVLYPDLWRRVAP